MVMISRPPWVRPPAPKEIPVTPVIHYFENGELPVSPVSPGFSTGIFPNLL
jgi:hypothetical protein